MSNTVIKLTKPFTKIDSISPVKCLYAMTREVEDYTGPCARVIESDLSTEEDIGFDPIDYISQDELTSHAAPDEGYITDLYDQKEFSDAVSVSGSRPIIVDAGTIETNNGEVCMSFDNTNDYLLADCPYSNKTPIVSIVMVISGADDGEQDNIIGTDPSSSGITIIKNSANKILVQTKRASGTIGLASITEILSGDTVVLGVVVDRNNDIKIYFDGVLDNSTADSDSNFVSSITSISIGASATGTLPSSLKWQFLAFWLTDESDNMAEYYTELSTRYDSTLTNENDFIYFSDTPVLLSNDYYANGRLVGDINFTESIKVFPWQGISQGGFGNIDIVNIDSVYNSVVATNYNKIDIYNYDGTTLTEFGSGEIKNIGFIEKGRIRVTIKSVIDKLNVELPTGRFTATDHADLENEKKQLCLGRVNLADVRLLDVATNEYFVADNIYNVVTVYDNGIALSDASSPVEFTQTTNGFTLTSNPVGRILCTVDGLENSAGTDYEKHISEHVPRLLNNIDIEYDETGLSSIYPLITSTWSGTDETVLTAINELLDGFMSYMYADSSGELQFGTLALPTSPTDTLVERETIGEIKAFRDTAQGLSERLQNSRNYNPYAPEGIAFGATEADKINLIKEYKRTSVLSGLHPFYKNKNNVDMKSQSLGGTTNGETILQDIIDLWADIRYFYTVSSTKDFDLNQVITLTHSQKGLESGKDVVVIEKKKSTLTNKITYKLWG